MGCDWNCKLSPNKGDAKPFDLLGIPLIILRDKENTIRVFHNVCSHRGYKILQKDCKIKNVLRCPTTHGLMILKVNLSQHLILEE